MWHPYWRPGKRPSNRGVAPLTLTLSPGRDREHVWSDNYHAKIRSTFRPVWSIHFIMSALEGWFSLTSSLFPRNVATLNTSSTPRDTVAIDLVSYLGAVKPYYKLNFVACLVFFWLFSRFIVDIIWCGNNFFFLFFFFLAIHCVNAHLDSVKLEMLLFIIWFQNNAIRCGERSF